MFFKSTYFVMFGGEEPEVVSPEVFDLGNSQFSARPASIKTDFVRLQLLHKKDCGEKFPFLRLNWQLGGDKNWKKSCKSFLVKFLTGIRLPARIFIFMHYDIEHDNFLQKFYRYDYNPRVPKLVDKTVNFAVSTWDVAGLFRDAVSEVITKTPIDSRQIFNELFFHLYSCNGAGAIEEFELEVAKRPRIDCYTVGYNEKVNSRQTLKNEDCYVYELVTTKRRIYLDKRGYPHKRPSNEDNKRIAYMHGIRSQVAFYRKWFLEHLKKDPAFYEYWIAQYKVNWDLVNLILFNCIDNFRKSAPLISVITYRLCQAVEYHAGLVKTLKTVNYLESINFILALSGSLQLVANNLLKLTAPASTPIRYRIENPEAAANIFKEINSYIEDEAFFGLSRATFCEMLGPNYYVFSEKQSSEAMREALCAGRRVDFSPMFC